MNKSPDLKVSIKKSGFLMMESIILRKNTVCNLVAFTTTDEMLT